MLQPLLDINSIYTSLTYCNGDEKHITDCNSGCITTECVQFTLTFGTGCSTQRMLQ